jgi:hypothetical protein
MIGRMFTFAIRGICKPHRRSRGSARRPVIAHIGPQSSGLRFAVAGSKDRNRRVIAMEFARVQHIAPNRSTSGSNVRLAPSPNRPGWSAPVRLLRARKYPIAGRAGDDPHICRPPGEPAGRALPGHDRSTASCRLLHDAVTVIAAELPALCGFGDTQANRKSQTGAKGIGERGLSILSRLISRRIIYDVECRYFNGTAFNCSDN